MAPTSVITAVCRPCPICHDSPVGLVVCGVVPGGMGPDGMRSMGYPAASARRVAGIVLARADPGDQRRRRACPGARGDRPGPVRMDRAGRRRAPPGHGCGAPQQLQRRLGRGRHRLRARADPVPGDPPQVGSRRVGVRHRRITGAGRHRGDAGRLWALTRPHRLRHQPGRQRRPVHPALGNGRGSADRGPTGSERPCRLVAIRRRPALGDRRRGRRCRWCSPSPPPLPAPSST